MKASELRKQGKYVHRHFTILLNGGHGIPTPSRIRDEIDEWDTVFGSKEDFDIWFRSAQIGIAELDEVMNYCKYFVRAKGNDGHYVRDGKSFPVHGEWCGLHDFDWTGGPPYNGYRATELFVNWLIENGWNSDTWFEIMDRYKDVKTS